MNNWTSIAEQLPPLEQSVWVKTKCGDEFKASLFFEEQPIYNRDMMIVGLGDNKEYVWSVDLGFQDYIAIDITHWRLN